MMKRAASSLLILLVAIGLLWPAPARADFVFPGGGFQDNLVVGGLGAPNAFDWLPNGHILIASQSGVVFRWDGSTAAPVLNISSAVCGGGETGLLGLAIDPAFGSGQRFAYLYYTHRRGVSCGNPADRANRVSRFSVDGNELLVNEQVLIDNIPAFNGNHNAGDLHFDKNGSLYISVGDSGRDLQTGQFEPNNGNARRLDLLNGKILRITRTGGIPAGNPFSNGMSCAATGMVPGAPVNAFKAQAQQQNKGGRKQAKGKHGKNHKKGGKKRNKHNHKRNHRKNHKRNRRNQNNNQTPPASICQEIFAFGLRNPFRFAFDPDDNSGQQRFYINDVGSGTWEEIDPGGAGFDYGWNVREGPCVISSTTNCAPDPRFVDPVAAYSRQGLSRPGVPDANFNGCVVITGGAFVPDGGSWPNSFDDAYLFADQGCARIFALRGEGAGATMSLFATGTTADSGAVHFAFDPDGATLYYTTFHGGGELHAISPA